MIFNLRQPSEIIATALRASRRHFLSAAVFSALLNLLFIAPMLYMLQIYDRVVPTQGEVTLLFLTLVILFALVTLSLLDFVRSRLLVRASVRLDRYIAGALLDTTLALRRHTGEAMGKQALREFDTLRQALTGPVILSLFDAPWSPVYILICFLIHPAIGALALVGAAVLVLITLRNEQLTHGPLKEANEAAGRAYASQEQSLAGAEVVRALGMRRALVRRHLQERETMMALQTDASLIASRYVTVSKFLRLALQSLALGLGAWLAIGNAISAGAIFASAFLIGRALAPVDQLLGAWRNVVQARDAYANLCDLFDAREADIALTQLPAPAGRIAVEHLTVLNAARDGAILADISFAVKPGEVVAVVGPSGAGKSTLMRMLAGAGQPDRGLVRFDGADISDWDSERLATFIGYLPQDTSLFAGTVKENIARFQNHVSKNASAIDEAVVEAARICGAHEMILRLPGGYDSLLGWGGRGLSAGQAQRVGLARALFRSPQILLLDEPNAHLDAEGESQLVATLAELKKRNVSAVVIAHRMGVLGVVDKILVLREGRIEAFGERDEVLGRLKAVQSAGGKLPQTAEG
jgi:PrtD family type I secretion system ABC transporter